MINKVTPTIITEHHERPVTENEIVTMEKIMKTFHENVQIATQPLIRNDSNDGAYIILPPRKIKP